MAAPSRTYDVNSGVTFLRRGTSVPVLADTVLPGINRIVLVRNEIEGLSILGHLSALKPKRSYCSANPYRLGKSIGR